MKILLLNASDIEGGAARAAYRLHQGLLGEGVESRMLVQTKSGDDPYVLGPESRLAKAMGHLRPRLDSLPVRTLYRVDKFVTFSAPWLPERLAARVKALAPDIVHLHWVTGGQARIETIARFDAPVVWTLHDMWAFTGGCHYDDACGRYLESCGLCPQLGSQRDADASRRILRRKRASWRPRDLTIVAPSRWLADCARASTLLRESRIEVIPNGLDLDRYRPHEKVMARAILGLPEDRNLILFGAMSVWDRRKGFEHLRQALLELSLRPTPRPTEVVIFGSGRPASPPELGFPIHYLGRLHDDVSLSLAYAAADVFVAPSVQDNLPNTVMEAMACGTPCVAFRIGGMPDMVDHGSNGYLARPFDPGDLAEGIRRLMTDEARRTAFGEAARRRCEKDFSASRTAEAYLSLYSELLDSRKSA